MTAEAVSARSRFRIVLNLCAAVWYVTCGLLLLLALGLGGFSAYLWLLHPLDAAGVDRTEELRKGVYLALACGLVDMGIIVYGRKYFRRAYERIGELEKLERRGPRGG